MNEENKDIITQINENNEYLEKSNKLINNIKKYYEIVNDVENVEMESEENA